MGDAGYSQQTRRLTTSVAKWTHQGRRVHYCWTGCVRLLPYRVASYQHSSMAHTGQVLQALGKVTQKGQACTNGQDGQGEMVGGMEEQRGAEGGRE